MAWPTRSCSMCVLAAAAGAQSCAARVLPAAAGTHRCGMCLAEVPYTSAYLNSFTSEWWIIAQKCSTLQTGAGAGAVGRGEAV